MENFTFKITVEIHKLNKSGFCISTEVKNLEVHVSAKNIMRAESMVRKTYKKPHYTILSLECELNGEYIYCAA